MQARLPMTTMLGNLKMFATDPLQMEPSDRWQYSKLNHHIITTLRNETSIFFCLTFRVSTRQVKVVKHDRRQLAHGK